MKQFFSLITTAFKEWQEDKATVWGASLSYFTLFSLSPLLLITISIAGLFFGEEAARGSVVKELQGLLGDSGAVLIEDTIQNASQAGAGLLATSIGFITLILGASGVFGQLKDALNAIFDVEKKGSGGIKGFFFEKLLTFSMVGVIGFLLIISLTVSALISGLNTYVSDILPLPQFLLESLNFIISFGIITILFALIYKILPDVKIPWKYLWIGSAITSLLFTIGKTVIGIYLGYSSVGSVYGAAGSLIIILVWVYYTALIFLFGAELTQVFALKRGALLTPKKGAVLLENSLEKKKNDKAILTRKAQENLQPFLAYILAGFIVEMMSRIFGFGKKK